MAGRYTYLVEKHDKAKDNTLPKAQATDNAGQASDPVPLVPPVPPKSKRVMKQRQPFDIYQDQYEALKQIALEERMRGGVGSMSAMVRDAIDKIIANKRAGKP